MLSASFTTLPPKGVAVLELTAKAGWFPQVRASQWALQLGFRAFNRRVRDDASSGGAPGEAMAWDWRPPSQSLGSLRVPVEWQKPDVLHERVHDLPDLKEKQKVGVAFPGPPVERLE